MKYKKVRVVDINVAHIVFTEEEYWIFMESHRFEDIDPITDLTNKSVIINHHYLERVIKDMKDEWDWDSDSDNMNTPFECIDLDRVEVINKTIESINNKYFNKYGFKVLGSRSGLSSHINIDKNEIILNADDSILTIKIQDQADILKKLMKSNITLT